MTSDLLRLAGFALLLAFGVAALGVSLSITEAEAAPPSGGFRFEQVIDTVVGGGRVDVYRFRDGPRVCYVAAANGAADTISCVVSP